MAPATTDKIGMFDQLRTRELPENPMFPVEPLGKT